MKLKKILGITLCAAMLSTAALSASAAPAPFNLMPASADKVTSEGGTATMENGVLSLKAGAAETKFTYEVNQAFNVSELSNMYFTLEQTGGFNIGLTTTAKNGDFSPSVSADFGNKTIFGDKTTDKNDPNVLGSLITTASVKDSDLVGEGTEADNSTINWLGAYSWNDNVPADGLVTVKTVTITLGANGTMKLSNFYMGAEVGAPASDATNTSATAGTTTTTKAGDTTAANGTTTTKKDNPKTGESTAMVAGGVVLALAAAGVVVLTTKKAK